MFLVGLSVILALALGVATSTLGAPNGDFFKVGKANIGASHVPLNNVERGPSCRAADRAFPRTCASCWPLAEDKTLESWLRVALTK